MFKRRKSSIFGAGLKQQHCRCVSDDRGRHQIPTKQTCASLSKPFQIIMIMLHEYSFSLYINCSFFVCTSTVKAYWQYLSHKTVSYNKEQMILCDESNRGNVLVWFLTLITLLLSHSVCFCCSWKSLIYLQISSQEISLSLCLPAPFFYLCRQTKLKILT